MSIPFHIFLIDFPKDIIFIYLIKFTFINLFFEQKPIAAHKIITPIQPKIKNNGSTNLINMTIKMTAIATPTIIPHLSLFPRNPCTDIFFCNSIRKASFCFILKSYSFS